MILTHLVMFQFLGGASTSDVVPEAPAHQGGGGGRKRQRKPFKSWDQRQREREAELKAQQEAIAARLARENKDKYGDLPPALEKALAEPATPKNRPLGAHQMREYERVRTRNDDEEAFALILGCL